MFLQAQRPEAPHVVSPDIRSGEAAELLFRVFTDIHQGFLPGARLEALIDHLEMRK